MKFLTHIARLLVAATFIFSGFVKLVDPLGSAYKFQEYFGVDVLNLEFLIPYALPFSVILILAEIMLGVMLLVGYLPKFTSWSLLLLILVFYISEAANKYIEYTTGIYSIVPRFIKLGVMIVIGIYLFMQKDYKFFK